MESEIMASYETKQNCEIRVFESSDEMATDLAEFISQASEISVKERGYFAIALSGGPLVRHMRKLCDAPYNKTLDWSKWYIFWVEERAVAKNHAESNYKLTKEEFISKVPILHGHVYSINDNATVEEAATDYEFVIRQLVKVQKVGVSVINDCPKFDLILLNIGPDGHVASLFPNHPALELKNDWVTYITDSPEPPPERITFTLPVINSASNIAIVATGEDRASAVSFSISDCQEGPDAKTIPAGMVQPTDGKLVWFLDEAAASSLEAANGLTSTKGTETTVEDMEIFDYEEIKVGFAKVAPSLHVSRYRTFSIQIRQLHEQLFIHSKKGCLTPTLEKRQAAELDIIFALNEELFM